MKSLFFKPQAGYVAPIVAWVAALEDARQRTLRSLDGLDESLIDRRPSGVGLSIGTLLYHIAAIEMDWLYTDILGTGFPEEIELWFPYQVRDEQEALTDVRGSTLSEHLQRLTICRGHLLGVLKSITAEDFQRIRTVGDYQTTPEWVLHHLLQHEAEHRGHIGMIRNQVEQAR